MAKQHILQICRLTPFLGIDLFKQVSLAYQEHDVTTVFLSGASVPALEKTYHGSVIFLEINHKKPLWRFRAAFKLWKLCRKHQFDMAICHHYKPTVIMDWVSYFCDIKKYCSVHHTLGNLRRLGRRLYTRFSLNRRWQFITVSDAVKQDLLDAGANIQNRQVTTVYNAIILDEILAEQLSREKARELLGIQPQQFVFGTIGRLVTEKGHLHLIKAFAKVHEQLPNSQLIILGKGPLEAILKTEIIALGLSEKIHIRSDHAQQAGHLIQAFDAFVFPSIQEGFGLVLLEAMAAKIPIIASNAGGIPEVLGETGLVVPLPLENLGEALKKIYEFSEIERKNSTISSYQRLVDSFLQLHLEASLIKVLNHPQMG